MCGLRDDCSVHFDANPDDRARERAFAIRDGAPEAEVMAAVAALVDPVTVLASAAPKPKRRGAPAR
jgi:hypothetical protein